MGGWGGGGWLARHLIAVKNGLSSILGKAGLLQTACLTQSARCLLMVIDQRFEVRYPQGYYGLLSLFTVILNADSPHRHV